MAFRASREYFETIVEKAADYYLIGDTFFVCETPLFTSQYLKG